MKNNTKKILLLSSISLLLSSLSHPIFNISANDYNAGFAGSSPGPALLSPIVSYDFVIYGHDNDTSDFHYNIINNHLTSYEWSPELNYYNEYSEISPTPIVFYYEQFKELVPVNSDYYTLFQVNSNSFSFDFLELDSIIFSFNNTYLDFRIFTDNELPFLKVGFFENISIDYSYSLKLDYSYVNTSNNLVSTSFSSEGVANTSSELSFSFELLEIENIPLINITGGTFIINFVEEPYYSIYDSASFVSFDTYMTYKNSGISSELFYSSVQIPPSFDGLNDFLSSSIGGFLDFEIFPGLSLSSIGLILIGLGMLFAILKIFFGG